MRAAALVELRGFGWRHAGRRRFAVRGVDLRIEPGERVLLLGPSGAGKSTLLAALAGLLPADSGDQEGAVLVDGVDARERAGRVGTVFQDPQAQLVMARAGDDVAFGLENHAVPAGAIWPRVDAALAAVGFAYGRHRSTDALSGGEQQRLALAGVLALEPTLLLLDEPTANLDPAGAALVREALGAVAARRRTTLVLVEHRVADAVGLVDRVVVLAPGGGIHADGPPERVFAAEGAALAAAGVWIPSWRHEVDQGVTDPKVEKAGPLVPDQLLAAGEVTVNSGEALALVGENGAGKTTLALQLGGLLKPPPGADPVLASPALAGPDAGRPPHRWRAAALARRIGSVFQNPEHQFVTGRVADELALGPHRVGLPDGEVRRVVADLLDRLRLSALAEANPYTLSGGEQRRLSVATALATAPRVLVLDEPTFGQDLLTWRELVGLLAQLRDAGRALVLATHDRDLVDVLADRTHALHRSVAAVS